MISIQLSKKVYYSLLFLLICSVTLAVSISSYDIIYVKNMALTAGVLALGLYFLFEKDFAFDVLNANIEDYSAPTDVNLFIKQLEAITTCLIFNGKVLIHCLAGHGRTGMALACVLMVLENLTADEALIFSKKECRGPERKCQEDFVKKLWRNIYPSTGKVLPK